MNGFQRLLADLMTVNGGDHHYVSTACLHDVHEECRHKCKFCGSPCLCGCHQ